MEVHAQDPAQPWSDDIYDSLEIHRCLLECEKPKGGQGAFDGLLIWEGCPITEASNSVASLPPSKDSTHKTPDTALSLAYG